MTIVTSHAPIGLSPFWGFLAVLSFFSPLPIVLLGLRFGFWSTMIASGMALALVGASKIVFASQINLLGLITQLAAVLVIIRFALLSRATEQGEEWYPAGQILLYLTVIAGLVTMATFWLLENGAQLLNEDEIRQFARQAVESSSAQLRVIEVVKSIFYFYPALNGIATVLLVILNTAIAQKFLEMRQENIRPLGAFSNIALPSFYLWVFIAVMGLSMVVFTGQLGANLLIVAAMPYFFIGLGLVHSWVRHFNLGAFALGVFYLVMLAFGWLIVLVTLLGICEPWLKPNPKAFEKLKG